MKNEKDFEIELEEEVLEPEQETSEETADEAAETDEAAEADEAAEIDEDTVKLPTNFLSFGDIGRDDVQVYIKQDVYKALEKYAASDTDREQGSILLGDYCEVHGKLHVIISGCIEAKYTDASSSTLTFTHETWSYIHKEHQRRHSEKKIVGWQHSHPNYGIFLSNYDLFIHENFFNLPFQLAYVVDPVQHIRGFFQWKDGKVEKLEGYYIYDKVNKPIKIPVSKPKEEKPAPAPSQSKWLKPLVLLLCLAVVILAICCGTMNARYKAQLEIQSANVFVLQTAISSHEQTIANQQAQLESQGVALQEQAAQIEAMQNPTPETQTPEAPADGEMVTFRSYTVQAGDSLEAICKAQGIDYAANWRIILSVNGISDPNRIYVGQTLLLPVTP